MITQFSTIDDLNARIVTKWQEELDSLVFIIESFWSAYTEMKLIAYFWACLLNVA